MIYKLSSAVTGRDLRNINMDPFISYIFTEDETVEKIETVEFQKQWRKYDLQTVVCSYRKLS